MHFITDLYSRGTSYLWGKQPADFELEEGLLANEDRSHESEPALQIELASPSPTEPKVNPDPVLLKFDLPLVGEVKIAKYWEVEDEEEEEEDGNKRAPLGPAQHAALISGVAGATLLSGYLGCKTGKSILGAGIAGAVTDLIKTYHAHTKERPWIRNTQRAIAAIGLASALYLQYGISDEKKAETLFRVLRALPWAYPAYGVFKAEMNEWNIPEKIVKLSKFLKDENIVSTELTKAQASAISAALQIASSLPLSLANIDQSLSAGAGIVFKSNIRKFMNLAAIQASGISDTLKRKVAGGGIAAASTAATVVGYVGNYLQWFSNIAGSLGSSLLLIGPSDAGVRTVKASIRLRVDEAKELKKAQKKQKYENVLCSLTTAQEKTWVDKTVQKAKAIGQGLLFAIPTAGMALLIGQMNSNPNNMATATPTTTPTPAASNMANSGLMAAILGDAAAFSKLGTKNYPVKAVMIASGLGVGLGVAAFTVNEVVKCFEWPLMPATIALSSIASSYAIYHLKRLTRPPKLKDLQEDAELAAAKNAAKAVKAAKKTKPSTRGNDS